MCTISVPESIDVISVRRALSSQRPRSSPGGTPGPGKFLSAHRRQTRRSGVLWRTVPTLLDLCFHSVDTQSRLVVTGRMSLQLRDVPVYVTGMSLRDQHLLYGCVRSRWQVATPAMLHLPFKKLGNWPFQMSPSLPAPGLGWRSIHPGMSFSLQGSF